MQIASGKRMDTLKSLVEPVLESFGLELLEMRFVPRSKRSLLQLTIDRMDAPVSITDCEDVSRQFSRVLDVEDPIGGSYNLEVSSPGFKRLLRIPRDLPRFVGHRVRITLAEPLENRKVWIGILKSTDDPLRIDKTEIGLLKIPFQIINKANLDD